MAAKFNAAFWKWFGDSQVVDAKGQPLVVYHGTAFEFYKFAEATSDRPSAYFFTTRLAVARFYARAAITGNLAYQRMSNQQRRVIAAYLRIEHPIVLDYGGAQKFRDDARMTSALREVWGGRHDGVIAKNIIDPIGSPAIVYAVIDSRQIKLAEGNDGTWDADDPDIRSNPPMLATHKGARWFHATDTDANGKAILASGTILASAPKDKSLTAPRGGFAYMSKKLETTAIYALGGVMMGRSMKGWRTEKGPYGWIFEVDTSDALDVEPDEDEVGELLEKLLNQKALQYDDPLFWLKSMAQKAVSPSRLERVKDGEYAYYASVGKQLLRLMSDSQKLAIMNHSQNLAVRGGAKFIAAWRLDKARSPEIKPDGSNVLEIAERIA